jgi:hypothetical protein
MIQVCRIQHSWICASPVILLAHSPWYVPKNHLRNPSKYYIYMSIFNNLDLVFPHLWLKMAARYRQMLADDRSRRIG